ncbi:MAG: protoheme IX farnesyltransferase [Deltaproteobacteria bacterium RIFCSPLOWO2_02_FULL_44_10]|nr:MAG: protoheme IX farnesyltransferase [Deltaproteobacteria bacterium RIFCSPHIGHO2_02_FULL_44_16]OGQ47570.1 MAG: protoheme IX farnesyltransferase [Deltaproteobacteria bacterium RIFCSPLOWO2_02_FULL_44_10]
MRHNVFAYLNLTKPRISLLFALSGLTALVIEGSLLTEQSRLWILVLAIFIIGGSANSFNQYFERDIDKLMARTARKRPLPLAQIRPRNALLFSILSGVLGSFLLWKFGGWLAAFLGLGTILFYSFYYTLWLKPRTPYNIVIGGIAGATGPLIGWAAATGTLHWIPFLIFLIIFLWTPPHFWALALCCKEDYAKVGLPMLPLVAGDEATRKQILLYSLVLVPVAVSLMLFESIGRFYGITSIILGAIFIGMTINLFVTKTTPVAWKLFGYSIVYLLLLLLALILDHFLT